MSANSLFSFPGSQSQTSLFRPELPANSARAAISKLRPCLWSFRLRDHRGLKSMENQARVHLRRPKHNLHPSCTPRPCRLLPLLVTLLSPRHLRQLCKTRLLGPILKPKGQSPLFPLYQWCRSFLHQTPLVAVSKGILAVLRKHQSQALKLPA